MKSKILILCFIFLQSAFASFVDRCVEETSSVIDLDRSLIQNHCENIIADPYSTTERAELASSRAQVCLGSIPEENNENIDLALALTHCSRLSYSNLTPEEFQVKIRALQFYYNQLKILSPDIEILVNYYFEPIANEVNTEEDYQKTTSCLLQVRSLIQEYDARLIERGSRIPRSEHHMRYNQIPVLNACIYPYEQNLQFNPEETLDCVRLSISNSRTRLYGNFSVDSSSPLLVETTGSYFSVHLDRCATEESRNLQREITQCLPSAESFLALIPEYDRSGRDPYTLCIMKVGYESLEDRSVE